MARPTTPLPAWATDGNYVAIGETWNATARRVATGLLAFAAAGLTPELPTEAQSMNEFLARLQEWAQYAADEVGIGLFGNGLAPLVITGGTTVMTNDVHATTLLVEGTGHLDTNGYRVFATESITVDASGIISCDGLAGGAAGGGGPGGAARAAGTLGAIAVGPNGGSGGNNGAPGAPISAALGGQGGAGGNSSGVETGGAGGTRTRPTTLHGGASAPTTVEEMVGHVLQAIAGWTLGGTTLNYNGGSPGGSGASGGGGGGSPGGVMLLCSPLIVNNGIVRCLGGAGGNGTGAGGGGGGGGGGALLRIVRQLITGSGTWSFAGGAGGAPAAGVAGVAGGVGGMGSWRI